MDDALPLPEETMGANEVRNWLGAYVLILTGFLGGYLFLAPEIALPLETSDRISCFQIILPFLLGQVAVVYRFFTDPHAAARGFAGTVPRWVIQAPPIIVTVLLVIALALFAVAGISRTTPPTPETFKGLVTFCVALLNASTVFVITRYFDSGHERKTSTHGGR